MNDYEEMFETMKKIAEEINRRRENKEEEKRQENIENEDNKNNEYKYEALWRELAKILNVKTTDDVLTVINTTFIIYSNKIATKIDLFKKIKEREVKKYE